jgi:Protein of unknown function (DUF1236)
MEPGCRQSRHQRLAAFRSKQSSGGGDITEVIMRDLLHRAALAGAIVACVGATAAAQGGNKGTTGAVAPDVRTAPSEKPTIPPLNLSDAQRAQIKQALASEDTEVSFALKSAKGAVNFQPSVGAKIPKGLKLNPLPRPLVYQMPLLQRYTYLKFKNQVLIVNPMQRKIVDMFPES